MLLKNTEDQIANWISKLTEDQIAKLHGDRLTVQVTEGVTLSIRQDANTIVASVYTEFDSKRVWVFRDLKDLQDPTCGLAILFTVADVSSLLVEDQIYLSVRIEAIARQQSRLVQICLAKK